MSFEITQNSPEVVPPNQAKEFAEKVKAELVLYPGEQHGFRQSATIQDVLEKELTFYQQYLLT